MKKIKICQGTNCSKHNISRLSSVIKDALCLDDKNKQAEYEVDFCGCTGFCEQGPNVWVDNKIIHQAKTDTIVQKIVNDEGLEKTPPKITDIKDDFLNDI